MAPEVDQVHETHQATKNQQFLDTIVCFITLVF